MALTDRARSGMRAAESLLDRLPVLGDYRSKEKRREADRRLRETIARQLEASRRRLTGLQRELVNRGRLHSLPELERAVGRLQLLIDRIKTAASGYAPFFDLERVREPELEQLITFDEAIARRVPDINAHIEAVNEAIRTGEGFEQALAALLADLQALNDELDHREETIGAVVSAGPTDEPTS